MAFTNLISTTNPVILERLHSIMVIWSDVLSEVKESGGGESVLPIKLYTIMRQITYTILSNKQCFGILGR
jgi:hypothetical protein